MAEKSTSQEIAENLKRLEIFKTLPDETIAGLVDHVEIVKLQPDQALFKQGDAGDAVYIIRDGRVKIVGTEKDGREIVFNQQGAGAVIGEMAPGSGSEPAWTRRRRPGRCPALPSTPRPSTTPHRAAPAALP